MYGGPEQAIRTINQNFGLDIQDYVTVNFASMAKIVDAFGGVNIDLTEDEISEINKICMRWRRNPLNQWQAMFLHMRRFRRAMACS